MTIQSINSNPSLGTHWDGSGVSFALYSGVAHGVTLCLFDSTTGAETRRISLAPALSGVWQVYVPDARPGLLYGYRVEGPYSPGEGMRCNSAKLLLDPYAKAMTGLVPADDLLLGYDVKKPDIADSRDSAEVMPKCVVVDERWDWAGDRHPQTPWAETVIYECHVKGLTKLHPWIAPELRGTYLGLASQPVIEHLLKLGVTAVELLPVQYFVTERRLAQLDLFNYWGYNTIGFFAPDVRYATSPLRAVAEFKTMVHALHKAGIEVILDVVYNHSAEGDELGPTLSFRGIDNRAYYHLEPGASGRYSNFTACGNTLNVPHPRTQQLIIDSLRYWVSEMRVDGFRFDLAPALCRKAGHVDPHLRFFNTILQDPVLKETKLLVEPWDAGQGGHWSGMFPAGICEWNGRYRDCVRRFWRGDGGQLAEFASRIAGSSDMFAGQHTPLAGVNYVTCHDGHTLHDIVSFAKKHNWANGEANRDGPADDFGQNFGVEGSTTNVEVIEIRERMKRNLLATLAFSQGVPMLTAGDEMGRTQLGNNNAYCQDNETSWVDWNLDGAKKEALEFMRRVLSVRRQYSSLRRNTFFRGRTGTNLPDVLWLDEAGQELSETQWRDPERRAFGALMRNVVNKEHILQRGEYEGTSFKRGSGPETMLLLLMNAYDDSRRFHLPPGLAWRAILNTNQPSDKAVYNDELTMPGMSLVLLGAGANESDHPATMSA